MIKFVIESNWGKITNLMSIVLLINLFYKNIKY